MIKRVGIFSGVFDPIHKGHVGLALAAIKQANLDEVYFLLESKPRRKVNVTHPAHRLAMIKLALKPYSKLKVLELNDRQLSVIKTLPKLKQKFTDAQLVFVLGADMLQHMPSWKHLDIFLEQVELAIGTKAKTDQSAVKRLLKLLPNQPKGFFIIESPQPSLSSQAIRRNLYQNSVTTGIVPSVARYINSNWLYVSPSSASSSS